MILNNLHELITNSPPLSSREFILGWEAHYLVPKTMAADKMANTEVELMIDDLIDRVQSMEHVGELSKLHTIEGEIIELQQKIHNAKERLSTAETLVHNTTRILRTISSVSRGFDGETRKTEDAWTSYWGIVQRQPHENANLEMQSADR